MTEGWIARLADDERKRDEVRDRELQAAAQKVELVRRHGRFAIDGLRATVTRDVNAFRLEFPDDPLRNVIVDEETEGGFSVRKDGNPSVSLTVNPRWESGLVNCRYSFRLDNGMPPREPRLDLALASDGHDAAHFKHHDSGELFATLDALSAYLLTPVFTGRPH
jgi:hypothetical protein